MLSIEMLNNLHCFRDIYIFKVSTVFNYFFNKHYDNQNVVIISKTHLRCLFNMYVNIVVFVVFI